MSIEAESFKIPPDTTAMVLADIQNFKNHKSYALNNMRLADPDLY